MLVSHSHHRYELSGTMDTDERNAEFIFTRRPSADLNEPVLPPQSHRQRYLEKLARYDGLFLPDFDVLYPTMTGSLVESFNQPRVRIGGSIYLKDPAEVMRNIPGGAMRYLGGPVTTETLALNALQNCVRVIVSEFEEFMIPRDDSMRIQ